MTSSSDDLEYLYDKEFEQQRKSVDLHSEEGLSQSIHQSQDSFGEEHKDVVELDNFERPDNQSSIREELSTRRGLSSALNYNNSLSSNLEDEEIMLSQGTKDVTRIFKNKLFQNQVNNQRYQD